MTSFIFRFLIGSLILFLFWSCSKKEKQLPNIIILLTDDHLSGLPKGTNYCAHGGGGYTGKWRGAKGGFLYQKRLHNEQIL